MLKTFAEIRKELVAKAGSGDELSRRICQSYSEFRSLVSDWCDIGTRVPERPAFLEARSDPHRQSSGDRCPRAAAGRLGRVIRIEWQKVLHSVRASARLLDHKRQETAFTSDCSLRQAIGGMSNVRLKARLNAASDS
jgi:hypothetical protein